VNIAFRWVLTACLIGSSTLLGSNALAQNNSSQNNSSQSNSSQNNSSQSNSSQTEATQDAQYTVQKGDTAFSISRRYNLSLEQLMSLNALTDSSVQLGQVLTVRDTTRGSSKDANKTGANTASSANAVVVTAALKMPLIRVQAPRLPVVAVLSASSETSALGATVVQSVPHIVPPAAQSDSSTPVVQNANTSSQTNFTVYTVQKGDTAYSIAKRYGLRLERLLALNTLSSAQVYLGQVLRVREVKASALSEPTSIGPTSSASNSTLQTYRVQKGDTLFSISRRFSITVSALQEANGLALSDLHSGLDLSVPAPLEAVLEPQNTPLGDPLAAPTPGELNPSQVNPSEGRPWRVKALSLLGVPYVFGGKSARGTDCSGFVLQVMASEGLTLPRRSSDQYAQGEAVAREDLQAGDLVFFDTSGSGSVSHVGIYLEGGQFINANSYLERVALDDLNSSYWTTRYLGARRVLVNSVARAF